MAIANGNRRKIRKVLIIGDNRLSSSILSSLANDDFELHQATHDQSTSESDSSLTIHKTGLSHEPLASLFAEVEPDLIISTQSAGSYDYQKSIIDSAIAHSIARFIPAEYGQDALHGGVQERLPPVKERARVIEYLQAQAQQAKIEWVGIATGCEIESGLASSNIGFDLKWQSATVHGSGEEEFAASSAAWSGRATLAVIDHWDEVKNQYIYASGMITTADEVVACLREKTGQSWETGSMDVEDIVHEAEKRFERGFPDAGMFLMERSVLYDGDLDAVRRFVEHDAKSMLGLDGESLDAVVKKVVHDVKHHGHGDCGCG